MLKFGDDAWFMQQCRVDFVLQVYPLAADWFWLHFTVARILPAVSKPVFKEFVPALDNSNVFGNVFPNACMK